MLRVYHHPALVNPTRWLGSPKKHAAELYHHGSYAPLQGNPFAQALTQLEASSPRTTAPLGTGIPMVVSAENLNLGKRQLTLVPAMGEEIHQPSRLMINSCKYIKSMINNPRATAKLVPLQYIQKNKLSKVRFVLPDSTPATIEEMYRRKIQSLIAHIAKDDSGENGIVLTKTEVPVQVQGGRTYVSNRGVCEGREVYVDYDKHPELSRLIIMYTDFKYL
jgi:hypothetical protein